MPYLTSTLWKLSTLTHEGEPADLESDDAPDQRSLAAACADCSRYSFPPGAHCRYCGSPRVQTVSLSGAAESHSNVWIFDALAQPGSKPN